MNPASLPARTGAQLLVDSLRVHGADMAFGVPGESYLAVLDAIYDARDEFKFIICRQEGGAAYMADAYGKLTGRPGICFVTRGPGATNASLGIHTSFQDSTPVILFIGQVSNEVVEREAFQEIDYRRMFGQMAKWVAQIDRADRVPEYISRAFHTATSGRPGPVVLALPEDMQTETAAVPIGERYQRVAGAPSAAHLQKLRDMLGKAERPFVVIGGGGWSKEACDDFAAFVAAYNLPVTCAYRCQDLIDNNDPHYVGDLAVGTNPKLIERIKSSDLLVVVGARLGEWTTLNYTLLDIPRPKQKFVHVHPDPEELGRVYQGDLLIAAGMPEFTAAARALVAQASSPAVVAQASSPAVVAQASSPAVVAQASPPALVAQASSPAARWSEWTEGARADLESWQQPVNPPGKVNMSEVVRIMQKRVPKDAIVTNGAGNFSLWVHRFYRYGGFRTQLGPTSGSMGYAVPTGVAAKLVHPDRTVISFAGDGDFLMTGQELATAMQYGANTIFVVVNNGMYGTIRMHQEREFPGRVSGTQLMNPDFAALARAYGAQGEVVEETSQFEPALERALTAKTASLIEVRVDPEAISPRATLSGLRAEAMKTKASA